MSAFIPISKGFTSVRGSLKMGVLDIGTQCGLVQRKSGSFVMLDSLTLDDSVKKQVDELTDGGRNIEVRSPCCSCYSYSTSLGLRKQSLHFEADSVRVKHIWIQQPNSTVKRHLFFALRARPHAPSCSSPPQ